MQQRVRRVCASHKQQVMADGYPGVEGVELMMRIMTMMMMTMMMMLVLMVVVVEHHSPSCERGSCSDALIAMLSPHGHNSRYFPSRYYSDRCKDSCRKNYYYYYHDDRCRDS